MINASRGRLALAVLLGVITALGQAPFDLPIVMFAGLLGVIWLYTRLQTAMEAARIGWGVGLGYFALSLQWIVSPFLVDAARHGWMAPFALVFLSAGLALFWAAAFAGSRKLSNEAWPLILCWPVAELVRAYIFTGFPWAMPSQALVGVMLGQSLAWIGPYALNLLLVAAAVAMIRAPRLIGAALGAGFAVLLLLPPSAGPAPLSGHVLRLVQPNAPQHEKWDPERIPFFYNRQLSLTAAPATDGQPAPSAVIWSETAIPWAVDRAGSILEQISEAAGGKPVVLGVQRHDGARYYNAMVLLGPGGEILQSYDKHHLVPFGEYIPLGDFASRFGLRGLAARDGGGYSAGQGARVIEVPGIGPALPLICYEAVFPHDVNAAPSRPNLMLHLTNDAWFGKAAGPLQHLAQARMRAIEQGVPVARSANTGVSAMIDPNGRITGMIPLGEAGFIDAPLPAPRPPTLYSRTGDVPLALLLLLGIVAATATLRSRNTD